VRAVLLCCVVVLGGTALAASNPPDPASAPKTSQKKPQAARPAPIAAADQRGTEQLPLVVKVLGPKAAEQHAEQRAPEVKSAPPEDRTLEVLAIVMTGVATVVVAIFTARLHYSTKGLWREAIKAGGNAEKAANAATASVELARKEFAVTHRPRIHIRHVHFAKWMKVGEPVAIKLVYVNHGDQEAKIVEYNVVTHISQDHMHVPQEPFATHPATSANISVGVGVEGSHVIESLEPISAVDFASLKNGPTKRLYCFAYVHYMDASAPPNLRKTSCCRVFKMSKLADDGKLKGSFVLTDDPSEYEYED